MTPRIPSLSPADKLQLIADALDGIRVRAITAAPHGFQVSPSDLLQQQESVWRFCTTSHGSPAHTEAERLLLIYTTWRYADPPRAAEWKARFDSFHLG